MRVILYKETRSAGRFERNSFSKPLLFASQAIVPNMSRTFSTTARNLLRIIWNGTEAIPKYDEIITKAVQSNPKLNGRAETVKLALVMLFVPSRKKILTSFSGTEHDSRADKKKRVSGQIFTKEGTRLTSGHWYYDGAVSYSQDPYNKA